jgi:3'-5' exonuclease
MRCLRAGHQRTGGVRFFCNDARGTDARCKGGESIAADTNLLNVTTMSNVIVWDIETVPDLKGFAAANGHVGKTDDEVRAELGDKFPKHIYHLVICIGALVAHRQEGGQWIVDALGAPHVGERSERELIASLVNRIAALSPQLVTFNGSSFDLPVLRYRAMVHGVAAPGES